MPRIPVALRAFREQARQQEAAQVKAAAKAPAAQPAAQTTTTAGDQTNGTQKVNQ